MPLDAQRKDLETLGFRIVSEREDELVAVRPKWHWDCLFTKLTYVVFVRRTPNLTVADIEADRTRLQDQAKQIDPSALPRGFQKGVVVLTCYLADHVDPAARELCEQSPKVRFAFFYLPAVLDQSSGRAHYIRSTPMWGALFYGKFRHIIGRLLEPARTSGGEPVSVAGVVFTCVLGLLILASLSRVLMR
jgi:hypothetical protein